MYLFSLILTSFVLSRVLGTLTPSGSVNIDCGGQQTFTCTVPGLAGWTITGMMGISATGSPGGSVATASARVTTPDPTQGTTSTITITGFNTSDNGGTVQCLDISSTTTVEGVATIAVGVPSCPTNARVTNRSNDFSSATITWDQPTNSPPVTSYDVTCNSSCTDMPCTSGSSTCRVLSVSQSQCEDYSVTVLPMNNCGSSTGCTDNVVAVPSQGPPQCIQLGLEFPDGDCPLFTYFDPGSILPTDVTILYRSLSGSEDLRLECSYPLEPKECNLDLEKGTYIFTPIPKNRCGSSSNCSSQTRAIPSNCTTGFKSIPGSLSSAALGGIIAAGIIVIIVSGAVGYPLVLLILACTCYSSIGFCGLLKCKCFNGKARRSSSKQRIDSASPVTPPAQPSAQPPSDEYADPQAIRDRKEKGKEDKDKIQYAAIDFSAGAGSGAGEVKIHQKEEPVIYTTVQHV